MSSNQQIPPLVQEQLAKLQQTQQNFQSIQMQKQQLESEKLETEKALEELKKASDDESVFKHAGTIMIKSNKKDLIDELEEHVELAKTKSEWILNTKNHDWHIFCQNICTTYFIHSKVRIFFSEMMRKLSVT